MPKSKYGGRIKFIEKIFKVSEQVIQVAKNVTRYVSVLRGDKKKYCLKRFMRILKNLYTMLMNPIINICEGTELKAAVGEAIK